MCAKTVVADSSSAKPDASRFRRATELRGCSRVRLSITAALSAPSKRTSGDGFIAAPAVNRVRRASDQRQTHAYGNDKLACGYRRPSADQALHFAFNRRPQRDRLTLAIADVGLLKARCCS